MPPLKKSLGDRLTEPRAKERLRESPSGLIVVQQGLTEEERKQRREDNKAAARSRKLHRKRKKHGRP